MSSDFENQNALSIGKICRTKTAIIGRFPVTFLLLLQYGALVIFPALWFDSRRTSFILTLVGVGLTVSVIVEGLLYPLEPSGRTRESVFRVETWQGVMISGIGALALLGGVALGAGTYEAQVSLRTISPLASLMTPFHPWSIVGPAMLLASWRQGETNKKTVLIALGSIIAVAFLTALLQGRMAPFMSLGLTLLMTSASVGLFRWREIVIASLLVWAIWPTIHQWRNETRVDTSVSISELGRMADAQERLRLDLNLARLAGRQFPADIGQPGTLEILRFGLIPRIVDTERGVLQTSVKLNRALGGTSTSAFSFTILGTVLFLSGWMGVVIYVTSVAVLLGWALRADGVLALPIAGLAIRLLVWVEASYPDGIAGFLQGVIAALLAMLLIKVVSALRNGIIVANSSARSR